MIHSFHIGKYSRKIIQYGNTIEVYNKPTNLTSASVFSDPPINISDIKEKEAVSISPQWEKAHWFERYTGKRI